MNLLPVATSAAPANAAGSEDPATSGSGDFTALLAMLVGAASTTLPIDTPTDLSGDASGSVDPSPLPAPTPTPVVGLPAPASPAGFDIPTPLVGEAIPAAVADVRDAPMAAVQDVSAPVVGDVPAPVVGDVPVPAVQRTPVIEARDAPVPAVPDAAMAAAVPAAVEASAPPAGQLRGRVDTPRAQPAAPAVPAQPGETEIPAQRAVPAQPPVSTAPAVPAPPAEEHERRSETLTLPEVANFDRPPLGEPSLPSREPDHGGDRRRPGAATVVPVERLQVDGPAADHVEAFPVPKALERPTAPVGPPGAPTQVVPLVAANRSNTLAPVDESPAAPAAPVTVPEQIVSAVVPLHGRGDGRHEVTLELRPDNLGTIRVEVVVEQQTVHLTLHAAEPATSRLLSANLPDLRSALADAGLTAGQVGVGFDGSGRGHRRHAPVEREDRPRLSGRAEHQPTIRTVRPMVAAGRLDLLL